MKHLYLPDSQRNEVISQMYALNALNFHPASSLIGGRSMMLEVVTALLFSNGSISGNLGICNLGMLTLCKCIIVHCKEIPQKRNTYTCVTIFSIPELINP